MHAFSLKHRLCRLHPALKALSGMLLTVCAAWWLLFGWLVVRAPLPYAALDFNHDGHISLGEAEYAASYGTRPVREGYKTCTEYFSLKDGQTLVTRCEKR
jgi:hypothetical protein